MNAHNLLAAETVCAESFDFFKRLLHWDLGEQLLRGIDRGANFHQGWGCGRGRKILQARAGARDEVIENTGDQNRGRSFEFFRFLKKKKNSPQNK